MFLCFFCSLSLSFSPVDAPSKLLSEASLFRQLVLEGGAANLARLQQVAREADAARRANAQPHAQQQQRQHGHALQADDDEPVTIHAQ